jgi:chromosome segregation ATPase
VVDTERGETRRLIAAETSQWQELESVMEKISTSLESIVEELDLTNTKLESLSALVEQLAARVTIAKQVRFGGEEELEEWDDSMARRDFKNRHFSSPTRDPHTAPSYGAAASLPKGRKPENWETALKEITSLQSQLMSRLGSSVSESQLRL